MHIKHTDGSFEYVPYFSLPSGELNEVIAPSCYSCFDYVNGLADLVCLYTSFSSYEESWLFVAPFYNVKMSSLPNLWLLSCSSYHPKLLLSFVGVLIFSCYCYGHWHIASC